VRVSGREFLSLGPGVERWIRQHCVHTSGRWTGKPFRLLDWQRRWLYELMEVDQDTGRRRVRMAVLGLPRKAGKTELAAAVAAYLAFGDGEPSAEVYCVASAEAQADRTFEAVRRMCELGPLGQLAMPPEGQRITQPTIRGLLDPYSVLVRLSSVGATKHGLSPSAVVMDELHAWKPTQQVELWEALTTGSGARAEPLILVISTAGDDLHDSRLGQLYRLGRAIERNEEPPRPWFHFRWYEAPQEMPIDDPRTWRAANPSLGHTVDESYYASVLTLEPEPVFRRYMLNQWVEPASSWLRAWDWDALAVPGLRLRERQPVWVGWDASTARDSTAVVAVQWQELAGTRRLAVTARTWERPRDAHGRLLEDWRVPVHEVLHYLEELCRTYDVRAIAYDPRLITWVADELESQGYPLVEWPQYDSRMVPASVRLYELIRDGVIAHTGDPVLRRHLLDSRVKTLREGFRLTKDERKNPNDAAVALAMAVAVMAQTQGRASGPLTIYVPEV
jgi:phage terminase large subunit-like protein